MPTCIIQSCPFRKLRRPRHPDVTLHPFPKSAWRTRAWLEQTGHRFKDIDAFIGRIFKTRKGGYYRICSAHFANDSYTLTGTTRVLKADAMPTIFPEGGKLIQEDPPQRRTRKERRRGSIKPPKPKVTSAEIAPALTKTDAAMQTQNGPPTAHRGVQTDPEDRSPSTQSVTPSKDENYRTKGMAWNFMPAAMKCDEGWRPMILNLTLEIIYILSGERPHCGEGDSSQNPPIKSQTPFPTIQKITRQKILEATRKVMELLTGEVPIRCQDVTAYFSMEEWEYIEGHKDLFKDHRTLTSPDRFLAKNSARSSKPFNNEDKSPLHSWYLTACGKEELSSSEEHLPCSEISPATCHRQIPSSCVKEEVLQADEHLKISSSTPHVQPTTIHTKDRQLSVKDGLQKSSISTPTPHTQPTTIHVKEGSLSEEEHLLNSNISQSTHQGQSRIVHVKKESFSDEEHVLNPKSVKSAHHTQPTILYNKGKLSDEEHLLKSKISTTTHHKRSRTIHVKKESFSDEEHVLNPKIVKSVHHTQPTTVHNNKKGTWSVEEHLPNLTISPSTHHRASSSIHIKERPLPDEEHLRSKITTPIRHTESTAVQSEEEEHFPHEIDYTTVIVDEDSLSDNEGSSPDSTISLSPGHPTSAHDRKGHPSREDGHVKNSNLYLPSSPIQYADTSSPECDGDLSIIPVTILPSGRTIPSNSDFSDRSLFCPECGKSFTDKARVEAHLRSHWGGKPYCCSVCLKGFHSKSKLVIHEMMHSGEKPYACSECDKRFAQKAYLQRHIRGHTGEKPFPCSICGKCFAWRSDMVKHEFTHTGARPHLCSQCGKRFTKKSHLNRHMRIHTGEKPFCCPDCGRSFGCNSDMVNHQRIHQGIKPFSCSECGKGFLRKQDAQRHQTVHR